MSSNAKPLIALGLTAVGTVLVANFQVSDAQVLGAASSTGATATQVPTGTKGTTSSASATTTPTVTPQTTNTTTAKTASASYANGTYSGAAVREPWGTFMVQATISGGELTAVTVVSEPSDRHSSSINSQAVPILTQEAISAQSAEIDMLSGATWTSQSYTTSLQAALDDAAAAASAQQNAG